MSTTSTFPLVNFVPSAIPAAFIATPGPVMATPQMAASTPATPAMAPAAAAQKYRKAPDAPKRFKSAFIIFSAAKHREIKDAKAKEGKHEKTTDIAKLVSEAWRQLEPDEKSKWEAEAQKDKARYEVEKHMYKGPWKVLANKRAPKDPSAPKRPMSAFLSYSNKLRAALKKENPNATNSDLSKLLSVKWQSLDMKEKKKFVDEEFELRSKYKIEMAEWRERNAEEKRVERAEREAIALRTAEAQALARPAMEQAAALQQQALAAQQQQVNMAVAANLQQQMMAAGVQQQQQQQQQQPTDGQPQGTENGQPSDGQQQNGQTGNTASTGEEAQQGQNNQAAAANGMFNMNMGGMQINPALLANNPFLAQQIQNQMQFQQLFAQQQFMAANMNQQGGAGFGQNTANQAAGAPGMMGQNPMFTGMPGNMQQPGMMGQNPMLNGMPGNMQQPGMTGQNPMLTGMPGNMQQQQQMQFPNMMQGQMMMMGMNPQQGSQQVSVEQQAMQQTMPNVAGDSNFQAVPALNVEEPPAMQAGQSNDQEQPQHELEVGGEADSFEA